MPFGVARRPERPRPGWIPALLRQPVAAGPENCCAKQRQIALKPRANQRQRSRERRRYGSGEERPETSPSDAVECMTVVQETTEIHRELVEGPGFYLGLCLAASELETLRGVITKQFLERTAGVAREAVSAFPAAGIEHYHQLCDRLDHENVWPKAARIVPTDTIGSNIGLRPIPRFTVAAR